MNHNTRTRFGNNSNSGRSKKTKNEYASVPCFLTKTYDIVCDMDINDIVTWNEQGSAFVILKTNEFCENVLPLHFKHRNLSSFVRQLNMYGFHKTKYKDSEHCFAHRFFVRDDKKLLLKMKRKTKGLAAERRSEAMTTKSQPNEDSDVYDMIRDIQQQVKEQDEKIKQLLNANKEFKSACMAMYTELESIKCNNVKSEPQSDNCNDKSKALNSLVRVENSDVMSMFNKFVGNFMQNVNNQQRSNILYGNKSDFVFKYETTYNKDLFQNQGTNNMIEKRSMMKSQQPNVGYSGMGSQNLTNFGNMGGMNMAVNNYNNINGGQRKRLRSPSPVGMQEWKRVTELSCDNISQGAPSEFSEGVPLSPNPHRNKFMRVGGQSFISDFDEVPKPVKMAECMSIGSVGKMNDYMVQSDDNRSNAPSMGFEPIKHFDTLSQHSKP